VVGGDGRSGGMAEMTGAGRMVGPERRGGCAGGAARGPAAWGRCAGASGVGAARGLAGHAGWRRAWPAVWPAAQGQHARAGGGSFAWWRYEIESVRKRRREEDDRFIIQRLCRVPDRGHSAKNFLKI
jgi:hypothetical protein